jgi:hypothetical protein
MRRKHYAHSLFHFTTLAIATLGFQVMDAPSQAVPPVISQIASTTNGAALSWSGETNAAYTVQIRDSLISGTWKNALMRYRWPWPFPRWADALTTVRAPRFYRVMAEMPRSPQRGRLLTNNGVGQLSTNEVRSVMLDLGASGFVSPRFPVTLLRFTYETADPFGIPIQASALLVFPQGITESFPLVAVQHGAGALKNSSPSQVTQSSSRRVGIAFGTLGYVAVVADYLGLGDSPGYQACGHAKSEATCVVDALRAARSLCASNQVALNGQLFLYGYSQGGHVTMSTHRELETFHTNEFSVTASAPSAGAYDLGGVTVEGILSDPTYPNPWYFPIILASYLPIYNLADSLEELLDTPYRLTLPRLLDGTHDSDVLASTMPTDMFRILRADFQADFRTNANNVLRRALSDNNLHSWTPRAPIKMFHCRGDRDVIFANAEVAYQDFTNRGACCVEVVDPGAPQILDHSGCFIPSLHAALTWFEQLKQ